MTEDEEPKTLNSIIEQVFFDNKNKELQCKLASNSMFGAYSNRVERLK